MRGYKLAASLPCRRSFRITHISAFNNANASCYSSACATYAILLSAGAKFFLALAARECRSAGRPKFSRAAIRFARNSRTRMRSGNARRRMKFHRVITGISADTVICKSQRERGRRVCRRKINSTQFSQISATYTGRRAIRAPRPRGLVSS